MKKHKWIYQKQPNGVFLAVTKCEKCGVIYNNGNVATSLYCPKCALVVKRERTKERVRRYRERQRSLTDVQNET